MKPDAPAVLKAATITTWLIAAMAIGAEISGTLKALLASFAGHHWTGKSIVSLFVFVILYTVFRRIKRPDNLLSGAIILALSGILGGVAIFGFFVAHFLLG